MMEEKIGKTDKVRESLSNEVVEPIFQELYVKLQYFNGKGFSLPSGIVNYYSLRSGDALHCELVELRSETQKVEEIRKEILVDIGGSLSEIRGEIPVATFDLYNVKEYDYALLKIKKVIKYR